MTPPEYERRNQDCPDFSPESLMSKFQSRLDSRAFEQLVAYYSASGLAAAGQILMDRSLAEDAVQEAFLHIVRNRRQYNNSKPFSCWFYTILRNICIDIIRRRKRHINALNEIAGWLKPADINHTGDFNAEELLRILPGSERAVLVLRIVHNMSFSEIASAMDISTEAAKKRAQRGLKRLREKLNASRKTRESVKILSFVRKPRCNSKEMSPNSQPKRNAFCEEKI